METIIVEHRPWKPAEQNERVLAAHELEGAQFFEGDVRLEDDDGNLVAVYCEANRADSGRLAWLGREILGQNYWHDGNVAASSSNRLSGLKYPNVAFGTTAPAPLRRRYACALAGLDRDLPRVAGELRNLAGTAFASYRAYAPSVADEMTTTAELQIHGDWFLGESPWTSGIINNSAALPYHRDGGNLAGIWSAMYVMRNRVTGGYLHLPEYDVMFACGDKSLLLFNGQSVWHGVTPMAMAPHPEAYRYSVVYYTKAGCRNCLSAADEAQRAQAKATEHDFPREHVLEGMENAPARDD